MEHIPHRDFRNQSSEVLRRVESGESIAITNHGKPVAVLHPLSEIGTAITPRSAREAFAVERFTVPDVAADLLGLLLAARGTSR